MARHSTLGGLLARCTRASVGKPAGHGKAAASFRQVELPRRVGLVAAVQQAVAPLRAFFSEKPAASRLVVKDDEETCPAKLTGGKRMSPVIQLLRGSPDYCPTALKLANDRFGVWFHNFSSYAGISPARRGQGTGSYSGRMFADYSIFKGKGALVLLPVPAKFKEISSGSLAVDRKGAIILKFMPALGQRKYDYQKRQYATLDIHVANSIEKTNDRISVPVSKAEFAVIRASLELLDNKLRVFGGEKDSKFRGILFILLKAVSQYLVQSILSTIRNSKELRGGAIEQLEKAQARLWEAEMIANA
ncbi:hypothetical protein ACLOJK_016904 [Asimina triloba]